MFSDRNGMLPTMKWRAARKALPVAKNRMEVNNHLILVLRESASLDVRSKVVGPPQPAALATSLKACIERKRTPAPMAMVLNVRHQLLIFIGSPGPLLQPLLLCVTAWGSGHVCRWSAPTNAVDQRPLPLTNTFELNQIALERHWD